MGTKRRMALRRLRKRQEKPRREPAHQLLHPPVLTFQGEVWRLAHPYVLVAPGGTMICVPEGFGFDLASIPRALWWLIAPFELSIVAPLIHDFLYRYQGDPPPSSIEPWRTYTRVETDQLFAWVMDLERVAGWRRRLAYRGVRVGGAGSWEKDPRKKRPRNKHTRAKERRER